MKFVAMLRFLSIKKVGFCLISLILITSSACAQNGNRLEGLWGGRELFGNSKKVDSLFISVAGVENPNYIIYSPQTYRLLTTRLSSNGDSLIHYTKDGSPVVIFLIKNNVLHDVRGIFGKQEYFVRINDKSPINTKKIEPPSSSFFDYSTTECGAGISFDDDKHKPFLPFAINSSFILQRGIDSLTFESWQKKIDKYGQSNEHLYDVTLFFNKYGYIKKAKAINIELNPDDPTYCVELDFIYFDESTGKLQCIQNNRLKEKTTFDKDNWAIDEFGQKRLPNHFIYWSYNSKTRLPKTALIQNRNAKPTIEYYFNASKQLTHILFVDKSMPNVLKAGDEYYYDAKGVLRKIVKIHQIKP